MENKVSILKAQSTILIATIVAILLIIVSLYTFSSQVNRYIDRDMHMQIDAMQNSSAHMAQNSLDYLNRISSLAVQFLNQKKIENDEDILKTLKEYAEAAKIVRALFVTFDGHVYTNYAGDLGRKEKDTSIDGILLSDIKEPIFSQPYYAEELGKVIFGVVSPITMAGKEGVLVSSYNADEFHETLQNQFAKGTTEVAILNGDGQVLISGEQDEFQTNIFQWLIQVPFLESSVEEMETNFANGTAGFCSYSVNGVERYFSYAPIATNDWILVANIKKTSLSTNLKNLQDYGFRLTIKLVVIMVILLFVITMVRYKEQKKMQKTLKKAAMVDGLTGILNRNATEKEIRTYLRGNGSALIILDIDDFKAINDNMGHIAGDIVLRDCARLLQEFFGKENIVGRMGGDEFMVFIKACEKPEEIKPQIEQFLNSISSQTDNKGEGFSVSMGIAFSEDECTFTELYQQADTALYQAKQQGKGKAVFYLT